MAPGPGIGLLDPRAVVESVGGDISFLQEIVDLFSEDSPKLLAGIRAAIAASDRQALERAAHTLKGSVSNFGAERARAAALQLEMLGRTGDLTGAAVACRSLEREVAQFTEALRALALHLSGTESS